MREKIIFLLLYFLISSLAFSQVKPEFIDITWGKNKFHQRKYTLRSIHKTAQHILAVKSKTSGTRHEELVLERLNDELSVNSPVKLDISYLNKPREYEFIIESGNQIHIFTSFLNEKQKKNYLFVQSLNPVTLTMNNDIQKICEIPVQSKYNKGSFHYAVSEDTSKILIFKSYPYHKRKHEKFGFLVFDSNFSKILQKETELPYNDELFKMERIKVDKSGNIYVLAVVYKKKVRDKRHGKPNYDYRLLAYTGNGTKYNEYSIGFNDYFISDMQFEADGQGNIICGGFYSEKESFSIKGTFILTIDTKAGHLRNVHYQRFKKNFLTLFMKDKKAKRGKELYEYDLNNFILRKDGGIILTAEQYYMNVAAPKYIEGNVNRRRSTTYYYNYNDIIVVNINPDGSIKWTKKIRKRQITTNDRGLNSSYFFTYYKDKMYFVFNDNPKNLYIIDAKRTYNFSKSSEVLTALVVMDMEGNLSKYALFSSFESNIVLRPRIFKKINPAEFIIYGQKNNWERYARMEIVE